MIPSVDREEYSRRLREQTQKLAKTDGLEQSSWLLLMMQRSTQCFPLSFDSQSLRNGVLRGKPRTIIRTSLYLLVRFDENSNSLSRMDQFEIFSGANYQMTEIEHHLSDGLDRISFRFIIPNYSSDYPESFRFPAFHCYCWIIALRFLLQQPNEVESDGVQKNLIAIFYVKRS